MVTLGMTSTLLAVLILLAFGMMLALCVAIVFIIFGIAGAGIAEGVNKALERMKTKR